MQWRSQRLRACAGCWPRSTLDDDLAIDTGCSVAEAKELRRAVRRFYKSEKCLGFLKGHGFGALLEVSTCRSERKKGRERLRELEREK